MTATYVARHVLKLGGATREPGELVPEAATWPALQSAITTGFLRPVEVPERKFAAAVRKYCPELAGELLPLKV